MDQYSHPEIEELMKIEENQKCFDCGNSNPKWASLNNAIFVCLKCAGLHRSFGINVSFIRSLTIDAWDDKQIEQLKRGGNKRFRDFLNEFQVPPNATMDFKYMIRASDYYRKLLKSEVHNVEPPFKPDIISGLEMLEYKANTNISNSTPITSSPISEAPKQQTVQSSSFFGKVGIVFNKAKESVSTAANKVSNKIKEMELKEKTLLFAKETGSFVVEKGKDASNFVVEKGKEAYHSDLVQKIAHRTEEGINVIVEKTKKLLNKENNQGIDVKIENTEMTTSNQTKEEEKETEAKHEDEIKIEQLN